MATRTTSKHFPSVIDRPAGRGSRNRTCEPAIKRRPPFIARCPTHRPAKPVRRKNPVKPGNTLRLSLSLSLFVPNNEHNGSISLGRLSFPQKRLHWMSGPKKKPIKARRLGHREGKLFSFNQPFPSRMPMFENLGQYCANSCLLIEISSIFELEYFIDMKSHVERLNQYVEPFKDCLSRSRLICRRLATWTFSLMNYSSTRAAILSISSLFCVSFPSPKTSFSISPGNGTPRTVVDVLFFLSFFFFFCWTILFSFVMRIRSRMQTIFGEDGRQRPREANDWAHAGPTFDASKKWSPSLSPAGPNQPSFCLFFY